MASDLSCPICPGVVASDRMALLEHYASAEHAVQRVAILMRKSDLSDLAPPTLHRTETSEYDADSEAEADWTKSTCKARIESCPGPHPLPSEVKVAKASMGFTADELNEIKKVDDFCKHEAEFGWRKKAFPPSTEADRESTFRYYATRGNRRSPTEPDDVPDNVIDDDSNVIPGTNEEIPRTQPTTPVDDYFVKPELHRNGVGMPRIPLIQVNSLHYEPPAHTVSKVEKVRMLYSKMRHDIQVDIVEKARNELIAGKVDRALKSDLAEIASHLQSAQLALDRILLLIQ